MQPTLLDAFKSNPTPFLLCFLAAGAGMVFGIVALVLIAKSPKLSMVLGLVAALAGVAAFGAGLLGFWSARVMTDAATSMEGLSARDRERLREHGYAESGYFIEFGAIGALPLLGGLVAFGAGFSRLRARATLRS